MNQEKLSNVLENHLKWLENNGEGERAKLRYVYLGGADLRGADLRGAELIGVYLSGADLRGTNLSGADLRGANLCGADLEDTDLRGADLRGANLSGADLRGAELIGVYLSGADLRGANLSGADLRGANLCGADLEDTDLRGARNIPKSLAARLLVCPEEGSFIGWKKCGQDEEIVIIKLLVTENAKRSSATTRKCRCSEAKVLDIQSVEGNSIIKEYYHKAYGHTTRYAVGEMIYPDSFDEDRWNECSNGIHFFITRQEAVDY